MCVCMCVCVYGNNSKAVIMPSGCLKPYIQSLKAECDDCRLTVL